MHDPMTQAFQISQFWRRKNKWGFRPAFITIWHVDPERGGSDDSCDWFGRKLTKREQAYADHLIDNEFDNLRSMFSTFVSAPCPVHANREDCYGAGCHLGDYMEHCEREEMKSRIKCMFSCYKRQFRWRYPVRWHFWHWKIQIHPLQNFKRWAFSRCEKCGKGFSWGYAPVSGCWDGTGPLWFRSEKYVQHSDCSRPKDECMASAGVEQRSGN